MKKLILIAILTLVCARNLQSDDPEGRNLAGKKIEWHGHMLKSERYPKT